MTDQVDARGYIFQVNDGTTPPGTWLDINGLLKWSLKLAENQEVANTTVMEDQGQYSSQPMQRGATLEITGRMYRSAENVRDPGQARIEALGLLMSESAVGALRFRHTVETEWTVYAGWVSLTEQGGAMNEKGAWGFTWNRNGGATTASVS